VKKNFVGDYKNMFVVTKYGREEAINVK